MLREEESLLTTIGRVVVMMGRLAPGEDTSGYERVDGDDQLEAPSAQWQ